MDSLPELIETLHRRLPPDAPPGAQWGAESMISSPLGLLVVTVRARVDMAGRRRERWSCDGVRMPLATLRLLTCPDTRCPQAQALRARWRSHLGLAAAAPGDAAVPAPPPASPSLPAPVAAPLAAPLAAPATPAASTTPATPVTPATPATPADPATPGDAGLLRPRPLMEEATLQVCGHQVTARPARFPCVTPCPHQAHPPRTDERSGYDLFEQGVCIAGGTTEDAGGRRPRIPTLQAAEAYVLARHLEANALLGALGLSPRTR